MKNICVYCGSSDNISNGYLESAKAFGEILANRGLNLVYGGGKTGVMGAVAEGVLQGGGEVIGVIPTIFNLPHLVHSGLTQLEVVANMHERKARMAELADGFVALPGGYGTFEELFEILTWAQIGLHAKPIGMLNIQGYFDPFVTMVEHITAEGFVYSEHRTLFVRDHNPISLLDMMMMYRPPKDLDRWVQRNG